MTMTKREFVQQLTMQLYVHSRIDLLEDTERRRSVAAEARRTADVMWNAWAKSFAWEQVTGHLGCPVNTSVARV
jgi:hypothetical protein